VTSVPVSIGKAVLSHAKLAGLQAREALLHLDGHHLHRDDRVVHEQAEREHQRAERNLVQADVEVMHDREGHREHERDRHRHHQARAEAEREEAHQQHDRHRLGEHLHELADRLAHRVRLVGDLAQCHARGQRGLQACELRLQRLAELDDVAAVLHRHRDADGVFAHEAHARRRRIGEAAADRRHVGDAERPIAHADGKLRIFVDRAQRTGDADLHAVAAGFEEARRHNRVLFRQRLLHRGERNAQRRQLGVGQLDPDLLVLQAD
jgi:hypothetical protein